MDWIQTLNGVLDSIEERLTDKVDPVALADMAHCSVFQFQRIFACVAGMPLAVYVRRRRMTLAAAELQRGSKVLDVALRYGYDSPTAFNRAFQLVHGVSPSRAKQPGVTLKSFPPIRFRIIIQGEVEMNYRIENKDTFTVLGMGRTFDMETSFVEIPKFWSEFFEKGFGKTVSGIYGLSVEGDDSGLFRYLIADPCAPDAAVPEGFEMVTVPALTWAVFEGQGPMPHALQKLNRRIYEEWLPNSAEYTVGAGYNIEMYTCGDMNSGEYRFEIWLPVKAKG